ncbi:hypothetical protein ARMSODRAFT_504107 [Armillaria solidipes]|uniref:Uncharacterized protein n=1 Tax=Armillaria solidipes TaxID=1076256 RepID=A0A2H3CE39_9AGAR|nr:hypothetical protein ARMSODRAFT_504107 [Armillaria solidipes]
MSAPSSTVATMDEEAEIKRMIEQIQILPDELRKALREVASDLKEKFNVELAAFEEKCNIELAASGKNIDIELTALREKQDMELAAIRKDIQEIREELISVRMCTQNLFVMYSEHELA